MKLLLENWRGYLKEQSELDGLKEWDPSDWVEASDPTGEFDPDNPEGLDYFEWLKGQEEGGETTKTGRFKYKVPNSEQEKGGPFTYYWSAKTNDLQVAGRSNRRYPLGAHSSLEDASKAAQSHWERTSTRSANAIVKLSLHQKKRAGEVWMYRSKEYPYLGQFVWFPNGYGPRKPSGTLMLRGSRRTMGQYDAVEEAEQAIVDFLEKNGVPATRISPQDDSSSME